MTVRDVYDFIDGVAPFGLTDRSFDNTGILVGDDEAAVTKIAVCLDVTNDIIGECVQKGANLIVSHHPVIFSGLKNVKKGTVVHNLIKNGISVISAHTNFDIADGGISDIMLDMLAFDTDGGAEVLQPVHPDGSGYGRVVTLKTPVTASELAEKCRQVFDCPCVRYCDCGREITKIGLCSGAGSDGMKYALGKGCDAYLCGDVKQNIFIDAMNAGLAVFDVLHYNSEVILCDVLRGKLAERFADTEVFTAEHNSGIIKAAVQP